MTASDDRTPPPRRLEGEHTDARRGGRRFSDREVALIIQRATELQQSESGEGESAAGGLSLDEIQEIAREAGIDPKLVGRAAREVDQRPVRAESSWFAGAPMKLFLERTIDGEVSEDEYEVLLELIRQTIGEPGQTSSVGRSFTWSSAWHAVSGFGRRPRVGRLIYISISPRNGVTTIRIEERTKPLAGQLFGGLMGGLGGGSGGIVMGIGMGMFGSMAVALGLWGGVIAGSYLIARGLFGRAVDKRSDELQTLMGQLADHVAQTAVLAPRLARQPARGALRPATPPDADDDSELDGG